MRDPLTDWLVYCAASYKPHCASNPSVCLSDPVRAPNFRFI